MVQNRTVKRLALMLGSVGLVALLSTVVTNSLGQAQAGALQIQVAGAERLAGAGDKQEAALVVAVNSAAGPVTGLNLSNFEARAMIVAPGGCLVTITRVVSTLAGLYLLDIVPFVGNPTCVWLRGRYLVGVLVNSPSGAGVGVAELLIDME